MRGMTALQYAKVLREKGWLPGPIFGQWIWWKNGKFCESVYLYSDSEPLTWLEVRALLKRKVW